MGPLGALLGLGGSAAAGAVGGLAARGKDAMLMDQDVQRDLDTLRTTGAIPQGVQPRFSLTPHRQRGIVGRYALGIGLGGFLAWVLTLIVSLSVIEGTGQEGSAVEKVFPSLMVAGLVGLGGFVVPGILIGAWLWLREARARVREATAVLYRKYWLVRERGAAALGQGQATPEQVAEVLFQFHTDSVPDPAAPPSGSWHGEVGQPLMITGEVQSVTEVYGEGASLNRYHRHFLRTGEGDLLSWMASRDHGLRAGDVVTLDGTVKAHSRAGDDACTDLWYCQIVGDVVRSPEP